MRPNSLFFDRSGRKGLSRLVSMLITIAFLAFVGYIVIRYKNLTYILREEFLSTPVFGWVLGAYALAFAAFVLILRRTNCRVRRMPWLWAIVLFLMALAPRLYFYSLIHTVPTSDFANYVDLGLAFTRGDYARIAATSAGYHLPSFSGLGVLNGLIMFVFGASARSLQLAQCVISSLSCVMVYLIARRFDEGSAPAAGFLFALYPANIIFSQVVSNQHLAVLFALASILLMLLAFSSERRARAGVYASLSGLMLIISYYAHPSTVTTLFAFGIFWLVLFFSSLRQKKELLRLLIVAAAFSIVYFGVRAGADAGMRAVGLLNHNTANSSMLVKVVIGLNPETAGGYSESDWGMIWRQPQSEQAAFCLRVIRERLAQEDLLGLFDTKIMRMWMLKDTSFGWPFFGMDTVPDSLAVFIKAYTLLDFFYVAALFLFAWIGGLLRRRGGAGDLLLLILLGWMCAHIFIEIQTRYRYFAMPFLMIFAAYGFFAIVGSRRRSHRAPAGAACVNPDAAAAEEIPPRSGNPDGPDGLFSAMTAAQNGIPGTETGSLDHAADHSNKEKGVIMTESYQDVNAKTVDRWVENGWEWGLPITHEQFLAAKKGSWSIVLTPTKPVPAEWFPDLKGLDLLGLACGGGQQMPLFAAAGARCTVLDYSERQLESERMVAQREGYEIEVVRADMSRPLPFGDCSFDIIVHPVSNCYIREVEPLWRECYRILKPGGVLLAGLDNGINYIFDDEETTLKHRLPFDPLSDPALYETCVNNDDGVQFSHTFEEQVGGQLKAGFALTHLFEDYNGSGRLHEYHIPTFIATRAVKPKK